MAKWPEPWQAGPWPRLLLALYQRAPPILALHTCQAQCAGFLLRVLPQPQQPLPALRELLRQLQLTRLCVAGGSATCSAAPLEHFRYAGPTEHGSRRVLVAPGASVPSRSSCPRLRMRSLRAAMRWSLTAQGLHNWQPHHFAR